MKQRGRVEDGAAQLQKVKQQRRRGKDGMEKRKREQREVHLSKDNPCSYSRQDKTVGHTSPSVTS